MAGADFEETDTYGPLGEALTKRLPEAYDVQSGEAIEYALQYETTGDTGARSFSTDVAVFDDGAPRVIIEVKRGAASTHDLLAYDAKAHAHKQVYPALSYGLVVVDADRLLTKKYLWHADTLDFLYFFSPMDQAADFQAEELEEFAAIVQRNLAAVEQVENVLAGKLRPRGFDRAARIS